MAGETPATEGDTPEARLKQAEIQIKEAELALKKLEIDSKRDWKRGFSTQLTPILATALLGLLATQLNSYFSSRSAIELEREKARSALIIKMIETSDPAISARNLNFLLDAGLIDDPSGKIRKLATSAKAPVLSSGSGEPIRFTPSARAQFLSLYREQFGAQSGPLSPEAVDNLGLMIDRIAEDRSLTSIPQVAYTLATIAYETAGSFRPRTEMGTDALLIQRYGPGRPIGRALGNLTDADAVRYRGRGYIQLTGRANYARMNQVLGLGGTPDDLVEHPERALDPGLSYRIAVAAMMDGRFTGKKLGDYVSGDRKDYRGARRVISGMDHAEEIAQTAGRFEAILNQSLQPQQP